MSELRKYKINTPQYFFYKEQHKYQNLDFVINIKKKI